ncbi:MAG TPA: ABC transporter permease [Actinomycetota bacterium]|nr:ABC transporter permease [Actinomycetota bacterium]
MNKVATRVRSNNLAAARSLLINLTLRENRSKYKRSALGWAWSMINPLATMLVFTFVFRLVFRIAPPEGDPSGLSNFGFFLICGLLPWNFLSAGLTGATGSVVANAGLIKKVYFTRAVLPASSVLSWNTYLLIELGVLSVALLFVGQVVFLYLPAALVVIALQMFFVLGIGLALSALNVYFRDIEHFLSILLLLWFYATPIIYPIDQVLNNSSITGPLRTIYLLNPMVHFTEAYRAIFYHLRSPGADTFFYMFVSAVVTMTFGLWLFRKLEAKFAEEL